MWKVTSAEVYAVIYAAHRNELVVHSSFTDSTGDGYEFSTGRPEIITEWGFKEADEPLIKLEAKKENKEDKAFDYKYFIYLHKNEQ